MLNFQDESGLLFMWKGFKNVASFILTVNLFSRKTQSELQNPAYFPTNISAFYTLSKFRCQRRLKAMTNEIPLIINIHTNLTQRRVPSEDIPDGKFLETDVICVFKRSLRGDEWRSDRVSCRCADLLTRVRKQ